MARKYLAADKRGIVADRAISGKNKKANYVKVGKSKGRIVYAKKGYEEKVRGSKTHPIRFFAAAPAVVRMPKPEEKVRGKVQVTGLVSVSYESKSKTFHSEMLFVWFGSASFDEQKLLDGAVEVLIDVLPEIERIPFELASVVAADFDRRGIEQVIEYDGDRQNELDFEVFIPRAGGRVLTTGSAHVEA